MPALDDILRQKTALLEAKQQKRTVLPASRQDGLVVQRGEKRLVSFSCNDYLGLTHHPKVIAVAQAAAAEYGAGAGASRLVTGNYRLYGQLENTLAGYKRAEAACVFGSGYLASIGTIPALVGKGDLIIADKLIHACMLDAARLSGATLLRFAHNNTEHCRLLLEANRGEHQHCLVLTETVFSMDGDCAPINKLKILCQRFNSWLMSDDAHGMGVLPPSDNAADIQMGTFSKAVGSYGGYVCGSQILVDYLKTAWQQIIYSAAYGTGEPDGPTASEPGLAARRGLTITTVPASLSCQP